MANIIGAAVKSVIGDAVKSVIGAAVKSVMGAAVKSAVRLFRALVALDLAVLASAASKIIFVLKLCTEPVANVEDSEILARAFSLLLRVASEENVWHLFRAVPRCLHPKFVSAVYQAYRVLNYLLPRVVRFVRYLQQPAIPKVPRHDKQRLYGVMAERDGERRRQRHMNRPFTTRNNNLRLR